MDSQNQGKIQKLPPERREIIERLLGEIRDGRTDPVAFAQTLLGVGLHRGQRIWLWVTTGTQVEKCWDDVLVYYEKRGEVLPWHSYEDFVSWFAIPKKKNILVPANRFGKSFVTAVKHIWMNYYKIGITAPPETLSRTSYKTLNIASHSEQARIGAEYIHHILRSNFTFWNEEKRCWVRNQCRIGSFLPKDGVVEKPYYTISFDNGAKYYARTMGDDRGGSVQGASYAYLSYDECSRSQRLEDEVEPDLLPRLFDLNGMLDLLSTPDKDSPSLQYYYELCELGREFRDGWWTLEGAMDENVFLQKESIAHAQENITDPDVLLQVTKGKFVFSGGRMFSGHKIRKLWRDTQSWSPLPITLLAVQSVFGKQYSTGMNVILGFDFARSQGGDATVGYALDCGKRPYEIICGYRIRGVPFTTQVRDIETLVRYYKARIIIDATSLGGKFIEEALAAVQPEPFEFKTKLKGEMLFLLKKVVDDERLIAPKPSLENTLYFLRRELGAYKEDDAKLHTDTVMALGMAVYAADAVPPGKVSPFKVFQRMNI